ncbi:MAG: tetratricopeptide repeat protein [Planctomycetota bacterium]|jgi:tetratricopeptide (TPR) repeat protein
MRQAIVFAVLVSVALAGGADQAKRQLEKGEFQQAADTARRLTKKDPANIDAWLVLADALVRLGEPADAWEALEAGMETSPDAALLNVKLGDVFVAMAVAEQRGSNDGTTIRNYYLDAERMYAEAAKKDAKSADAVYGQAFVNFWLGDKAKAKELVALCLGLNADHGKAHALQGYIFYTDKKFAEAQAKYEVALKLDDSDPLTYVRYGHTFVAQGKDNEAKDAYLAGLKRHPQNDLPIRSGLYHLANRGKRASWLNLEPYLMEAVKLAPTSAPAWYYLGYCHLQNGRHESALAAYRKADKSAPGNATYLFNIGYCHELLGDAKDALDYYRKALKAQPDHPDAANRFYGIAIVKRGKIKEASALFEELIELAPNTSSIHNDYALILRNWAEKNGATQKVPPQEVRQRIKRSGEVYELAARLAPDDPQIQSDTGLLFEFYPCNFNAAKAKRYFTRSLDISGYVYRDAFDGLFRLCTKTGDWKTLRDYAANVVDALGEGGRHAVAPVGAGVPKELPNETPGLLARARSALKQAEAKLGEEE